MCILQPRANWEATAARRQFPVLSYRRRQVAGQRGQRVPQLCEASVCLIFFSVTVAGRWRGSEDSVFLSCARPACASFSFQLPSPAGGGAARTVCSSVVRGQRVPHFLLSYRRRPSLSWPTLI
ncbi:hypothetical protein GBAR_LOCUS14865 [Geodia barretti]|uniref:Uncharacterized protein n=1 Tax=Geodia barretti TaxID=519541 RepID=A0AA35S953_GEOBA|nr:hypothetical protein GBAR_LOCUS14865 [Geodia barretti]